MTRLEKLIVKLCPDGVEFKELGEVIGYQQPTKFIVKSTDYDNSFETPVLTAGATFILGYTNEKEGVFPATKKDSVIIFDDFTTSFHWVDFNFKVKSSAMKILYNEDDTKTIFRYVYFAMKCINFQPAQHARHWIQIYSKIKIPIPPLSIQEEIVRILDKFTSLEAELEAELEARRQQYEYYRDSLFEYGDEVEWKKLGEVCDFVRGPFGGSLKKEIFRKSGYAVYEQQHAIYGEYNFRYFIDEEKYNEMRRFEVKEGDLIMSCSGTMGKISIIPQDAPRGIINQALLKLTAKDEVNNQYLKYCFENSISAQMNSNARGGAIKNVASVSILKEIKIPVPPLEEQERIVAILDRFDALVNDISQGIPAEIEARRKQYEYYRDKLLTFKEVV
jgi:type I restriction enzyme S subunit